MLINLSEIYAKLEEWRDKHGITAQSQKTAYIVKVMEELGELAQALRDYEKIKNGEQVIKKYIASEWNENNAKYALLKYRKVTLADAEHEIIDALCDIAVLTINAGADIDSDESDEKDKNIYTDDLRHADWVMFETLVLSCGKFSFSYPILYFNDILKSCAKLCEHYGYNFEIAMLETIKKTNTHNADYENARIKK